MTETPPTVGGDLPPYRPGDCHVAGCVEKATHTPVAYVWPRHLKPMERTDKNGMPIRLGVLCCAGHRELVQRDIRMFLRQQIPVSVPKMYEAMGWKGEPDADNFRVYMLDLEDADERVPPPAPGAAVDLRNGAPPSDADDGDAHPANDPIFHKETPDGHQE
jgi:hypothetical protein